MVRLPVGHLNYKLIRNIKGNIDTLTKLKLICVIERT
jgi:hypothetical protein